MATTTNYGWDTPDDTDLVKDGAAAIRTLGSSVDTTTKNLNPQTTTGALAYRSATANINTALPLGTANQVLRVNSGGTAPEWATTADQTPLTTKGDLFTFSTVDARLGVGANNTILVADSNEATGLKWAAPASSGYVFISRTNLSASASPLSLNSIFTSTYDNYFITMTNTQSSTASQINLLLRASGSDDTGANYFYGKLVRDWNAGSFSSGSATSQTSFTGFSYNELNKENALYAHIMNPQVAKHTSVLSKQNTFNELVEFTGILKTSTAYDGLSLTWSGNLTSVITVYGLAKS